jgi:uncharacterized membrane protein
MADIHAHAAPMIDMSPHVRRIDGTDLRWALAEGWRDFKERRGDFLLLPFIYPLAGFIALGLALNRTYLPMLFPVVAGLSILGPAVAAGFYELARRREAGLDSSWVHFIDPLQGRGRTELGLLTLGLLILFAAWLGAADLIYNVTLGAQGTLSLSDFLVRLFTTAQGWTMIIAGNLVGLVFAAAAMSLSLVSFPMVVDRPGSAATAVATSLRAVRANPGATIAWGVSVALILAVACVPFFLGLPIALPLLGYATWHLYTRLVER